MVNSVKHTARLALFGMAILLMLGIMVIGLAMAPTTANAVQPPRTPPRASPTIYSGGYQGNITPRSPVRPTQSGESVALPTSAAFDSQSAVATAYAISTAMFMDVSTVQVNATAVSGGELKELMATRSTTSEFASLTAEETAVVEALTAAGSEFYYDETTNTITALLSVDEATLDFAIAVGLESAGYSPDTLEADLIAGGVVVTLQNFSITTPQGEQSGVLVMTVILTVENGAVSYTIAAASLNGVELPPAALASVEATIDVALESVETEAYTIESLSITDTSLNAVVTLYLD